MLLCVGGYDILLLLYSIVYCIILLVLSIDSIYSILLSIE